MRIEVLIDQKKFEGGGAYQKKGTKSSHYSTALVKFQSINIFTEIYYINGWKCIEPNCLGSNRKGYTTDDLQELEQALKRLNQFFEHFLIPCSDQSKREK